MGLNWPENSSRIRSSRIRRAIKEETGTDFKPEAGDPTWLPVEGFLDKTSDPEVLLGEVKKLLAK
jgi:hypothetical protein